MSNAGRRGTVVSHGRTRNESILIDREVHIKEMYESKKEQLTLLTRRIKQLNKDNLRKDQEIKSVDE